MVKKPKRRTRRQPQRTCVGCREVLPKRSLIRIVRGADGVVVDESGKAPGRGAYLHDKRRCWQRGINGALDHALKTKLSGQERALLSAYLDEKIESPDKMSRFED
jgi:hypothetical protein